MVQFVMMCAAGLVGLLLGELAMRLGAARAERRRRSP
jgi:hypothetical protein